MTQLHPAGLEHYAATSSSRTGAARGHAEHAAERFFRQRHHASMSEFEKLTSIWAMTRRNALVSKSSSTGPLRFSTPELFRCEFRLAIASMSLPQSLIERFDVPGPELYAPTNDRAVVGSLVDYRYLCGGMIDAAQPDVRRINANLNDAPISVLGMASAIDVVRGLA